MRIPGIYTQRDPRWGNNELGYNTDPNYNMYHFGCLITGFANMLWYMGNPTADPGAVNQWMKDHGGFQAGGGLVIWGAFQPLLDQVNSTAHGFSSDLNAVNAFLQPDNNYAIAWITKPGFDMHWSVMPYVGQLADSWDGILKPVGSYTFHGAYLYTKNIPAPSPAPAPAPPPPPVVIPPVVVPDPVQPQPEPPVVAPQPHPVPTNPVPQKDPNQDLITRLINFFKKLLGLK